MTVLWQRKKVAINCVVTPPHRSSRGQALAPQSCMRQKMDKTLGSAGPQFENGSVLTIRGVQHRDIDVVRGDAVDLLREPDNVSFYLCFLI